MFFNFNRNTHSAAKNVSAQEAHDLIQNDKELVILDVRTPEEYKAGHLPKAKLLPHSLIPVKIKDIEKYKEKPVLVYFCQATAILLLA